jgi:hypothetical protein
MTGIRGLFTPPLAIGLYYALQSFHAGAGPLALLLPFALIVSGALKFRRMHLARSAAASA